MMNDQCRTAEVLPGWLQAIVRRAIKDEDWPGDKYPDLAVEARDQVTTEIEGDDVQLCLLQLLIDEIVRLRAERDGPDGAQTRELAALIAKRLFTNGSGDRAQRLVFTVDTPVKRDLGGWCFEAAVDQIAAQLSQARRKTAEARRKGSTAAHAYHAGYNCGLTEATEENCDFSFFRSVETTKWWQRGKADAEAGRKESTAEDAEENGGGGKSE